MCNAVFFVKKMQKCSAARKSLAASDVLQDNRGPTVTSRPGLRTKAVAGCSGAGLVLGAYIVPFGDVSNE